MDVVPIRRALISVSDKTGVTDLARALAERGVAILSTGGTARALREAGLAVSEVAEVTGAPEMLDGRVKTLHPAIHGGILARRDTDAGELAQHGIGAIDLVVVNLYPFEATVAAGAAAGDVVEQIDIGGPAMLRAAAKNHPWVCALTDVEDYPALLDELDAHGGTTLAFRLRLALTAFGRTAAYDAAVAGWMAARLDDPAPRRVTVAGHLVSTLRYGENPHQRAAFYRSGPGGLPDAETVQGKPLSYNNIADADAARALVAEFQAPACVIVKHANPCGVAVAETAAEAYARAVDGDRVSAFGGIVALNRPLDAAAAAAITAIFTEVVVAPGADADARAVFAEKPNLRLLLSPLPDPRAPSARVSQVAGGFLLQDADTAPAPDFRVVTRRAPTEAEMADLSFAWTVVRHVKSNAIVYAKDARSVGIGAGQMSRVDATRIAARKAADMAEALGLPQTLAHGAAVASDAFFPFPDGLIAAAEAGATAVVQPGGSVRDAEVIAAADARGLAMVFSGMRHFRH